jgi:hypothetical protein
VVRVSTNECRIEDFNSEVGPEGKGHSLSGSGSKDRQWKDRQWKDRQMKRSTMKRSTNEKIDNEKIDKWKDRQL